MQDGDVLAKYINILLNKYFILKEVSNKILASFLCEILSYMLFL